MAHGYHIARGPSFADVLNTAACCTVALSDQAGNKK